MALVLGSGGIVGGAFHAGVLKALYDTWELDAREVDLIIGTSAGALAGSLITAGVHPNDVFRRELRQPLSPQGQRIIGEARKHRPKSTRARGAVGLPAAPAAVFRAMQRPANAAPGSVAAALLPRGTASTGAVAGMVEGLFGNKWPTHPRLEMCAVELATSQRVVFGAGGIATPSEAAAASSAVPAVFEPAVIDGKEYIDGGVHSANNLDLIGDRPFDLVVVSSPMGTVSPVPSALDQWSLVRAVSRWQTEVERQRIPNVKELVIVRPKREDLDAMGPNMLNADRRASVAIQAHATASAYFRLLGVPGGS
ncbi:MAG: patatin-like phospholipase family protein [Acidimicrobiales bacterium]